MVENYRYKIGVVGSIPTAVTKKSERGFGRIVKIKWKYKYPGNPFNLSKS